MPPPKPKTHVLYERYKPEESLLYQLIEDNHQHLENYLNQQHKYPPSYVIKEFERYLECGRLENGFLRVRCDDYHHERLVAFSCKKRGFCPSCGASAMAQTATLLTDHILPHQPIRQYVLSLPFPLRFLLAAKPELISPILKIITHSIEKAIIKKAGYALQKVVVLKIAEAKAVKNSSTAKQPALAGLACF